MYVTSGPPSSLHEFSNTLVRSFTGVNGTSVKRIGNVEIGVHLMARAN